jgi:hypothetical protein
VIDTTLFPPGTPIPPGGSISSEVITVSGAEHVAVNVVLRSPNQDVYRIIFSGRRLRTEGTGRPQQTDSIGETGNLWSLVPVHGPLLAVGLENRGSQPAEVDYATLYGVVHVDPTP